MAALPKISDYKIRIATTEDRPELSEFINKFFYTAEPLNEALNHAKNDTSGRAFIDFPMPYLSQGLALIAVAPSGEIIGTALNAEVKPEEDVYETTENANSSFDYIHKLLNHVEEKITDISNKGINNIKEMEVRVLTVHENWRNRGIGRILLEHSKNLAQEKGFKQIRSICTSAYTSKMFIRCGFDCVYSLEYKDCQEKGILDYLPHDPHTHINGMIKKL